MCDTDTDADSASLADEHADLSQLFEDPGHTSQEIVRSVFGLKQGEIRAYFALVEHPHSSVDPLADILDQHRRYVARSLRGLHNVGLAKREQRILDTGGQGYVYDPAPVDELKQYLQNQVDEWVTHLRAEIESLDGQIEVEVASDGGTNDCSHETED